MKYVFYALCALLVGVLGYFGYKKWFAKDDTAAEKDSAPEAQADTKPTETPKADVPPVAEERTAPQSALSSFVAAPTPRSVFDFMPKPVPASSLIRLPNPLIKVAQSSVIAPVKGIIPPVPPVIPTKGTPVVSVNSLPNKGTTITSLNPLTNKGNTVTPSIVPVKSSIVPTSKNTLAPIVPVVVGQKGKNGATLV